MTVRINASSAGLVETVDTSGILELQTANTSALIIDTSQNANFASTGAITVPVGTTNNRPTGVNGMIRYNTTTAAFEYFANNVWALANVTPPPTNTVAPVISGSTTVGSNLTSTTGTWTNSPTSYAYQWRANSVNITANATSNVFTLTSTQDGANITCNVTAINAAGNSTPATSNSLGPVTSTYTISYLVVAGGAGGGGGPGYTGGHGGGGAGGYLANTTSFTPGVVYTVTVGAGGGGGYSDTGSNGGNSQLTAPSGFSNVTSTGGGGGGGNYNNGSAGGSGGGGNYARSGGSGTAGQGNNGGGGGGGGDYSGGGGGGAGATGGTPAGGSGTASSITGLSVTYAAGGNGGQGGGGGGAANTGNGGKGGDNSVDLTSGSGGGSGVVILSIPTASYSNITTGSPNVTTSGSNTILKFTSSGSYTA